jgi:hypothetical protein
MTLQSVGIYVSEYRFMKLLLFLSRCTRHRIRYLPRSSLWGCRRLPESVDPERQKSLDFRAAYPYSSCDTVVSEVVWAEREECLEDFYEDVNLSQQTWVAADPIFLISNCLEFAVVVIQ